MKKQGKVLAGSLLGFTAVGALSLWWLKTSQTKAGEHELRALRGALRQTEGWYFPSLENKPMIIFYPDNQTETAVYSLWGELLSKAGYPVFLMETPLGLPKLALKNLSQVLNRYPTSEYILQGVGAGAKVLAQHVLQQPQDDRLKGLVLFQVVPEFQEVLPLLEKQVPTLLFFQQQEKKWPKFAKKATYDDFDITSFNQQVLTWLANLT